VSVVCGKGWDACGSAGQVGLALQTVLLVVRLLFVVVTSLQ
jgi:RNA 3'-terminal phosphate cyclase